MKELSITKLGSGLIKLETGWELSEFPNKLKVFSIRYNILEVLLNEVFNLSTWFNLNDNFGKYVRSLFKGFFIYDDNLYSVPYPPPNINDILNEWEKFKESQGLKYSLLPEVDCDDFSRMFQEFLAFRFRWNLAGCAWGLLGEGSEGKPLEWYGHAFNWVGIPLLCDVSSGKAYVWFVIVEPQISMFTEPLPTGEGVIKLSNAYYVYRPYVCMG